MADLLVECKVCLDAKPLMSSTVTKSGQEIAVACAICHFHSGAASRVRKRLSILAGVFTKRASQKKDCEREEVPVRDAAAANSQRRGPQGG